MKKYLFFSSFILLSFFGFCQVSQNSIWYFGEYAGVDFSNEDPIGIIGGQLTGLEGCATICDHSGNLLFYSDGQRVYNANHEVMENGDNLMGHWSSAQSVMILPKLNPQRSDSKQYYLFTTDDGGEQHLVDSWRYSIIDMSLDGGLGAITEEKNILIEDMITERQVAVSHSNGNDIWLVGHRWNSDEFVAYLLTNDGIADTPIVSAVGPVNEGGWSANSIYNGWVNAAGFLKTNLDGDRLAVTQHSIGQFELYDFNKSTGIVSNYRSSPSFFRGYGVEFSPDGTKLYGTYDIYSSEAKLIQYDLEAAEPFSNYEIIRTSSKLSGLQLGPNGKIYIARDGSSFLGEISNPNELGQLCNCDENAIYLQGNDCKSGLPSIFYSADFVQVIYGAEEIEVKALASLFPNPVKNKLSIEFEGKFDVNILNNQGQLIKTISDQENTCQVDCSKFSLGIYMINILSKEGSKTYKIIKL